MLHYMPGCDVRKNHQTEIEKLTAYMKNKGAVIDNCCRDEEPFIEKGDTIVCNCTMCDMIFREAYSDTEHRSLYNYVLEDGDFPWPNHNGEKVILQDCWRSRGDSQLHEDIRKCLERMNFTVIELDKNRADSDYCGVWLYNDIPDVCVKLAPNTVGRIQEEHIKKTSESQQKLLMKERVAYYNSICSNEDMPVLVYCNGCERGIKMGGGKPMHIVELLAELIELEIN